MPDNFFDLSPAKQDDIVERAYIETGISRVILRKDIWVVWALQTLFTSTFADKLVFCPPSAPMAQI